MTLQQNKQCLVLVAILAICTLIIFSTCDSDNQSLAEVDTVDCSNPENQGTLAIYNKRSSLNVSEQAELYQATGGRVCIDLSLFYEDSGEAGEDLWIEKTITKPAKGMNVQVISVSDEFIWEGFLGDGQGSEVGCTPLLDAGHYDILIRSISQLPSGSIVKTVDAATGVESELVYSDVAVEGEKVELLVLAGNDEKIINVHSAAVFSVSRQLVDTSFDFLVVAQSDLSRHSDGVAYISDNHWDNKFVIAHEVGHSLSHLMIEAKGIFDRNYDTSYVDSVCPTIDKNGNNCDFSDQCSSSHSMGSLEWSQTAMWEGLAHFISANAWNTAEEGDCFFEYYKSHPATDDRSPSINCASGTSDWPKKYATAVCVSNDLSFGAELDWLRTFWMMRTYSQGFSMQSLLDDWIAEAAVQAKSWAGSEVVSYLNERAKGLGRKFYCGWSSAYKSHLVSSSH